MSAFTGATVRLFNHLPKREATGEGGLLTGTNPAAFTTSDALRLWIVQVGIIIIVTQLLSLGLRRLRQPKVVAEVLGGILLGPTAFGRIPGFTDNIFPSVSLPYLTLVADIGLCLFLFLIGLKLKIDVIKRNARMSTIVSLAGIVLPFGLGAALSVPIYHHFIDPSVRFTFFMLFTGIAYSISAFSVLCRVLTELNLLDTQIGIIAVSAGAGNDIVGWTLVAVSVALVNASSALSALWILVVCVAFIVFLLFPVKFVMHWLARKTGSTENGPTMFYMTVVMILVWACAFFADAIGVNAIFGAFLAGLTIPREGGFTITITEKLEDMVLVIFLPIYFTLSGLSTDLGLLDNGITWGFTIAIIVFAFLGKFVGCAIASRIAGFGWRESSTIGALMTYKGLVELIVLNIGLQANVLSQRVFSMYVLMAITLTLIATPLVLALYPPECRGRAGGGALPAEDGERGRYDEKAFIITEEEPWRHRFTVVLDKLDHIPGAMALTQLILPQRSIPSDVTLTTTTTHTIDRVTKMPDVSMEALQLIELSDWTSTMMKSSAADSLVHTEPVLGIFRMFGELNELAVTTSLSVVPYNDFAHSVAEHAQRHGSHLILLPWLLPVTPTVADSPESGVSMGGRKGEHNPFDVLFGSVSGSKMDAPPSEIHSQFVRGVFSQSKTDVALFIDTGDRSGVRFGGSVHVFLPFFGGPDDRLALELVVQLCLNPRTTATVMRIVEREGVAESAGARLGEEMKRPPMIHSKDRLDAGGPMGLIPRGDGSKEASTIALQGTIHSRQTTQTRIHSEAADNIVWSKYASSTTTTTTSSSSATHTNAQADPAIPTLRDALSRIHFSDAHTPGPLHAAVHHARALRETSPRLLIMAGRSKRVARESHDAEMKRVMETCRSGVGVEVLRRTIGDVGAAMVAAVGSTRGVVVVQAAEAGR